MEWISVKDRLPELDEPVLVFSKGDYKLSALCKEIPTFEETFKAFDYWEDIDELHHVTHWMPLPEPPKDTK